MVMSVYFGDSEKTRWAFLVCPCRCGHLAKADASTGDASAKMAVETAMKAHLTQDCPNNPDREVSEMEKWLGGLKDRNK